MSHPRGPIKDTTPILGRIDHRLFPNDLRHIKLALVDHCIDSDLDPGDLTVSLQLMEQLLPLVQLQNDAWLALTKSDLNTKSVALKGFYDCIRNQLGNSDSLREKIQESKEDRELCLVIDQKNDSEPITHSAKDNTPTAPSHKSEAPTPAPPKKSPPQKNVTFADEVTKAKPPPGKFITVRMTPEQHGHYQHELQVQHSWCVYREKKREMKIARKNWEKLSGINKAYLSPESEQNE